MVKGSKRAWLYSIRKGNLSVRKVTLKEKPAGGTVWCDVIYNKRRMSSQRTEPGIVVYGTMWLPKRDDERAKEIFIEYEESRIAYEEEKLEKHKARVDILKRSDCPITVYD